MSPSKPLSERSPNHQPTSTATTTSSSGGEVLDKPIKLNTSGVNNNINNDQKKAMPRLELNSNTTLNHSHTHNQQQQQGLTYVSPSDAIRSPTTKKLSEIKGKRFQYVML